MLTPHTDIRVDFPGDGALSVSFRARMLPGAEILAGTSAGFSSRTVPGPSRFQLAIARKGIHAIEHDDGSRIEMGPGDACLLPVDKPWTSIAREPASFVTFALPHTLLARAGIEIGAAARSSLLPGPAVPFLLSYADTLLRADLDMSASEAALYAGHIQDLACLALGARRGEAGVRAKARGLRAARLAAIKADIKANIDDKNLSLDWLAGRHALSPRAIRDLFYGEGTSFTDHLLGARLDLARDLLCSPAPGGGRLVTAIAFEAGFGDLSWFYQAFRRRFGMSPTEMRETMREAERNGKRLSP